MFAKLFYFFFFFNDTATTEIYTLSLHDALPIGPSSGPTCSAIPGRTRSSAATAWRHNRAGSLSPASSDSQATGHRPRRAQSARRGRGTNPGCGRGTCSLVASRASCPDAATPGGAAADGSAIGPTPQRAQRQPASPPGEPHCRTGLARSLPQPGRLLDAAVPCACGRLRGTFVPGAVAEDSTPSAPSGDAQARGAFVACRVTDTSRLTAGHLIHPTGGLPHDRSKRSTVIPRDSPGQAHADPAVRGCVPRLHRRVDRQPGASLHPA